MSQSLNKVGVIGGSGYVGRELIKILLAHPQASIEYISARELAGKNISLAHPSLSAVSDLSFCTFDPTKFSLCDVVFSWTTNVGVTIDVDFTISVFNLNSVVSP